MIGVEDFQRYAETTMQVAGGDVDAQFQAWGIDKDGFFAWATLHANGMAARFGADPRSYVISFFSGFEAGYRAAVESGAAGGESAPDVIDFDETDRRHD